MRTWSTLAATAALIAGMASASQAQTTSKTTAGPVNPLLPTTGTREISVSGQFQFDPYDSYNINGRYGPFLNPNIEVGGDIGYQYTKPRGGGGDSNTFSIGPFINYHFPGASATLPYVGAFFGFENSKASGFSNQSVTAYGLQAGAKHFLNANVAAFAELQYRKFSKKIIDDKDSQTQLQLGLAFYLR